ncbi:hypothetical protein BRADI_5g21986v3 [Brachypodium distachyon]|uniref:Uncharacterized protein n=1 Tax=Brachypodium distachyon TaxID=15368 RepID=I1J1W7_BRADI|nr:hypothetical protein BRADI_5g21986v3 [Brachypodium distachyon]
MEEFVWGLQLNEETCKPEAEDVFMNEDHDTMPLGTLAKDDNTQFASDQRRNHH